MLRKLREHIGRQISLLGVRCVFIIQSHGCVLCDVNRTTVVLSTFRCKRRHVEFMDTV